MPVTERSLRHILCIPEQSTGSEPSPCCSWISSPIGLPTRNAEEVQSANYIWLLPLTFRRRPRLPPGTAAGMARRGCVRLVLPRRGDLRTDHRPQIPPPRHAMIRHTAKDPGPSCGSGPTGGHGWAFLHHARPNTGESKTRSTRAATMAGSQNGGVTTEGSGSRSTSPGRRWRGFPRQGASNAFHEGRRQASGRVRTEPLPHVAPLARWWDTSPHDGDRTHTTGPSMSVIPASPTRADRGVTGFLRRGRPPVRKRPRVPRRGHRHRVRRGRARSWRR